MKSLSLLMAKGKESHFWHVWASCSSSSPFFYSCFHWWTGLGERASVFNPNRILHTHTDDRLIHCSVIGVNWCLVLDTSTCSHGSKAHTLGFTDDCSTQWATHQKPTTRLDLGRSSVTQTQEVTSQDNTHVRTESTCLDFSITVVTVDTCLTLWPWGTRSMYCAMCL